MYNTYVAYMYVKISRVFSVSFALITKNSELVLSAIPPTPEG